MEGEKISWVSWNRVCKPQKDRGLRVKDLKVFNFSLLFKWLWRRMLNKGSICYDLLIYRYGDLARCCLGEGGATVLEESSLWWMDLICLCLGGSWCKVEWKDMMSYRVGNGRCLKFWPDPSCSKCSFKELFPGLCAVTDNYDISVENMGMWVKNQWELEVWHVCVGGRIGESV